MWRFWKESKSYRNIKQNQVALISYGSGVNMGNIIKGNFKKDKAFLERMNRIRVSLEKINELLEKIKNKDIENEDGLG